jgi:acyl-CoA synthetase (AMP-forming)/AMP-acid ligase II
MRATRGTFFPDMSSVAQETSLLASRQWTTLVDALRWRATHQADRLGYRFLDDCESSDISLTYGDLDRRARAIAAALLAREAGGTRALLVYPPGLDFVSAWFGCAYAGVTVVAVPALPTARARRFVATASAIAHDSQPAVVLTTARMRESLPREWLEQTPWITTDTDSPDAPAGAADSVIDGTAVAFLQYTSGSTAAPRGVMVTHANLFSNLAAIAQTFWRPSDAGSVSWLPPYHDMGLIGAILAPLYVGSPVTLMSPLAFVQRPHRWLEAITRFRAAVSGGPNFAYAHCLRRITPEQRAGLELSSWRVAFNGAEPVDPGTIREFTARFAACGFAPESFKPCYGLAESTLLVSVNATPLPPRIQSFRRADLERRRVSPCVDDTADARALASCGQPLAPTLSVDPESRLRLAPGEIGEIWLAGPSVAGGYWNRPDETAQTFGAQLADGTGPFLRTGDLGFLLDGELFVTGRLKDLIIIDGANHYPQDIERTAGSSHPALDAANCVALSVELDGRESLVLVAAVPAAFRASFADVQRAIRTAVAERHDLRIHDIRLVKRGDIPRTASGKVQRHACRDAYLAGGLQ